MAQTDFMTLLENRYSCRKFTDEQLTEEELSTILEAARMSPTARNNQPVRLCVVQSAEGLAKVDECTKCRYNAPTAIIIAYDTTVASPVGEEHGPDACVSFGDIDATIAITNMENAAASLGLGSCWIGAFNPKVTRQIFNVPENYKLVELMMFGHKAADPSPMHTNRHPVADMVVEESF